MQVLNHNGSLSLSFLSTYIYITALRRSLICELKCCSQTLLCVIGSSCFFFFETRLGEALRMYIEKDKPFLGICLGLQLLFDSSEENGHGILFFCIISFHILNVQTIQYCMWQLLPHTVTCQNVVPGGTINLTYTNHHVLIYVFLCLILSRPFLFVFFNSIIC